MRLDEHHMHCAEMRGGHLPPPRPLLIPTPSTAHPGMYTMPPGRFDTGHYLAVDRSRDYQWGQLNVIEFLIRLSEVWYRRHSSQPFGVADLSLANGKSPPGHNTHTKGLFVDIRFPRSDGQRLPVDAGSYDAGLVRSLAFTIFDLAPTSMKTFIHEDRKLEREIRQYRAQHGLAAKVNLVYHGNHKDHFHIQFNSVPAPPPTHQQPTFNYQAGHGQGLAP